MRIVKLCHKSALAISKLAAYMLFQWQTHGRALVLLFNEIWHITSMDIHICSSLLTSKFKRTVLKQLIVCHWKSIHACIPWTIKTWKSALEWKIIWGNLERNNLFMKWQLEEQCLWKYAAWKLIVSFVCWIRRLQQIHSIPYRYQFIVLDWVELTLPISLMGFVFVLLLLVCLNQLVSLVPLMPSTAEKSCCLPNSYGKLWSYHLKFNNTFFKIGKTFNWNLI